MLIAKKQLGKIEKKRRKLRFLTASITLQVITNFSFYFKVTETRSHRHRQCIIGELIHLECQSVDPYVKKRSLSYKFNK